MAMIMLSEWSGSELANGEHLDYAKAFVGALCDLDHTKVPVMRPRRSRRVARRTK